MAEVTRKAIDRTETGPPRPAVEDLVEAFLKKRSPHTRRAYASDLGRFAEFLAEKSPTTAMDRLIAAGHAGGNRIVLKYRNHMAEQNLSPATKNRRLAAIRSAMKLARTLGLITWTLEVEGEKIRPYRDTAGPGEDAYRAMLAVSDARNRAILRLLHDLGLRRGELTAMDLSDVDLENRTLSILGKVGKGRSQPERLTIPHPTAEAVEEWILERGTDPGPLFMARVKPWVGHRLTGESIRNLVASTARRAGICTVRPHGLRHTGITTALERTGGNVSNVARYSRHASIETVKLYDDNRRDVAGEVASLVAAD